MNTRNILFIVVLLFSSFALSARILKAQCTLASDPFEEFNHEKEERHHHKECVEKEAASEEDTEAISDAISNYSSAEEEMLELNPATESATEEVSQDVQNAIEESMKAVDAVERKEDHVEKVNEREEQHLEEEHEKIDEETKQEIVEIINKKEEELHDILEQIEEEKEELKEMREDKDIVDIETDGEEVVVCKKVKKHHEDDWEGEEWTDNEDYFLN
mgnify:CR=1 FL=1